MSQIIICITNINQQICNQQISSTAWTRLLTQVLTRTAQEVHCAHVHEQSPLQYKQIQKFSLVFFSLWCHTRTRFGTIWCVQGFIMGPMVIWSVATNPCSILLRLHIPSLPVLDFSTQKDAHVSDYYLHIPLLPVLDFSTQKVHMSQIITSISFRY